MLVTLVTYFGFERGMVVFGILHLIGFSIMLGSFFARFKYVNLVLGMLIVVLGLFFKKIILDTFWFVVLGFPFYGFYTFDYYPIFPWFGVFLLGLFLGKMFYPFGKQKYKFSEIGYLKPVSYLGRVSLWVYLIHIPIVYGLVYLLKVLL